MELRILAETDSILAKFIAELRDHQIQNDSMRFRRNLERIGQVMAYEISKKLNYEEKEIITPLGEAKARITSDTLVLGTILRAGLPLHQGFLGFFDQAENAFVSAYRKYNSKYDFDIHIEYISSPEIDNKTLILTDPMLASGASFELAYKAMLTKGIPAKTHFATVIASKQGVEYLLDTFKDTNITLWCAAIDPELNSKSYIIPGLGDAGDLAYGNKT